MSKTARSEAYTITQVSVGRRIQWVRELRMPNRAACARLMELDRSTLAKIESGERAPSIFNIIELANRFQCTTDFLLRGLLISRMDEDLLSALSARHPELAPQMTYILEGRGTAPAEGTRPRLKASA